VRAWPACGRRRARAAASRTLLALVAFAAAGRATAQVRTTIDIESDDRYRGRSVSQGRPTASLDLSYDAASGAYLGAAVTVVAARHEGLQVLAGQAYAGYVARLPQGPSIDLGVTQTHYSEYYSGDEEADFTEVYAGLITRLFSTRLYYSPNYFDRHQATLYGEADTAFRPAPKWRLSAHAGVLTRVSGTPFPGQKSTEYDWRLGLSRAVLGCEAEVAWSGAGPGRDYYGGESRSRSGVVVALRHSF
jgi:uncharacterized protein (TIGR02001 family)